MSDIDREAEKERLREQLEEEQEQREATQQMSELLLKGATMTNAHCDTCGDPIFRYEGEEFCPTCQQRVSADTGNQSTAAETESADSSDETAPQSTDSPDQQNTPSGGTQTTPASKPTTTQEHSGAAQADSDSHRSVTRPDTQPATDLQEARSSLIHTLTTFANRAAATEDAARAQQLLATAREAAEALAALNRATQ